MASAHAPRRRPREIEDPLNLHIFHPLGTALARLLLPTGISPNAVSVMNAVLLCAATWAYVSLAWPQGVLLGFLFMLAWHVTDGADGDLARMRGTASQFGELVDGVCDYFGNVVMYFAFAFLLDDTIGGWAWTLAIAAGASHIIQTNHAETQRRNYLWWAYGVPWLKQVEGGGDKVFARQHWFSRYFSFWATAYLMLAKAMSPSVPAIDAKIAAAKGDPAKIARIQRLTRGASHCAMRYQKALGANPKTLIIAASMAAGSPLWFFLTEIFALNFLLILSVRHHNRVGRRLAAALSR